MLIPLSHENRSEGIRLEAELWKGPCATGNIPAITETLGMQNFFFFVETRNLFIFYSSSFQFYANRFSKMKNFIVVLRGNRSRFNHNRLLELHAR